MNDKQEKYDELDNIVSTLDTLIDEIENEHYIEMLREIKFEAEEELEEVQEDLRQERDAEEKEMNYQYERSVS